MHTKGPWKVSSSTIVVNQTIPGTLKIICNTIPILYHGIGDENVPMKEAIFNARLIAAAPDLLEALKDARFALYGYGPGNPKIDAAIAKAEGEISDGR